jgi:hypothetical protein
MVIRWQTGTGDALNDITPERFLRFGGPPDTAITAATVAVLIVALVLIFLLSKKYLIPVFLFTALLIPAGQVVVIAGLHLTIFRLVAAFAWVRLAVGRSRVETFRLGRVDKSVLTWAASSILFFTILWVNWGALINRLGLLYNVLGMYFLLRFAIRDRDDVKRTVLTLAWICAITAGVMIIEQKTGRNLFSAFGGVPELTGVREGRLRSQGPFMHPLVAGTVGATLLPLFLALCWRESRSSRSVAAVGIVSSLVMVWTAASSTPLLALLAGLVACALWPMRSHMRLFRWGMVTCIIALQVVMKAPVWALIQRSNLVGGSSGWHRYGLVNATIVHFRDWWLTGAQDPGSWGIGLYDVSNTYVDEAVTGGLLTLVLFLGIFWQGFAQVGIARRLSTADLKLELEVWALGAALVSTATGFMGIRFFDQSILVWYSLLAMICAVTLVARSSHVMQERRHDQCEHCDALRESRVS